MLPARVPLDPLADWGGGLMGGADHAQFDLVLVGLLVLAGLGALAAFRSGARGAYRVARQTQEVTRMGGNLARALGTTVVIVGVQWAVVSFTSDFRAWALALGVPALVAGSVN
ncbi:MAG: hypothetical protein ACREQ5_31625, partial [Candidatus Dormibacteria bacterium]